jgi:uncharacterized protein YhfF
MKYALFALLWWAASLPVHAAQTAVAECDRLAAHPEDPQRVTPGVHQSRIDYPLAIAVCEKAIAAEPTNARSRYQLARVLFYSGQNERAVQEMQRSADAGHIQAQYIFATFIARNRPFAPTDICLAERYWRQSAEAGRQASRVQYLRFELKGRFAACTNVADDAQLSRFVEAIAKDAGGVYEQLYVEDFREALDKRPTAAIRSFWQQCSAAQSLQTPHPLRIKRFGDSAPMTTQLSQLILSGEKTITATSPWIYERDVAQTPIVGGYFVMTDAEGAPLAVLRTTGLRTLPFDRVTEDYSRYEGIPVRPLEAWRQVHRGFFTRALAPHGKEWRADMPVTLERFEVVCRR